MDLVQPYYIEPRSTDNSISLDGEWDFCCTDEETELDKLIFEHKASVPESIYHSLHRAGLLPDPYVGTNSHLYRFTTNKVWYYRRKINIDEGLDEKNAFLCFDGIAYFSRVFLNGELLGEHEGMFGGPVIDIADKLNIGENELIVEVKASIYKDPCQFRARGGLGGNKQIVPWNITLDSDTSNGDFIVIGIWNHARLVILPKVHISRPFLFTEEASDDAARLSLEMEIADGKIRELHKYFTLGYKNTAYSRAYDNGLSGCVLDDFVEIKTELSFGGECVYSTTDKVNLTDFNNLGMDERFHELQFFKKEIELKNPKLWYPIGLGEQNLYDVNITLVYHGFKIDSHGFKTGIRTFGADYTAGRKYRAGWNKFLFNVNGKQFFLKGMNWTQIDYIYAIDRSRYEWCLTLAKNAGIQFIRVWNGGGMPETDDFYDICDRIGILVWQDLFIANTPNTSSFPPEVLEAQTAYNIYRIRNHPSLALICGGNEFTPYTIENSANMFIMQRVSQMLAPDRIFHYTTADMGSAHIYIDMEPVWYRHRYRELPFLGESGIHSFPNYKTIKQLISEREATSTLPNLSSPEFKEGFPEIINHFAEYLPDRVPRMTARISQIIDMKSITLRDICEASQVQGYEWYQLMIQSIRENYPRCGGIMPWVFKRPWATAGIQTVDGDDRPGYCYYAVKNSYAEVNIAWLQEWSILAPSERISLKTRVFGFDEQKHSNALVRLTVYAPDLSVAKEYEARAMEELDFGFFELPDGFTDTAFLVCAELSFGEKVISRSVYFNKCTELLKNEALLSEYRSSPKENLRLDGGPWLKASVANARKAAINAETVARGHDGKYSFAEIEIRNISDAPAFPVTLDIASDTQRCFLSDNFFMLKPNESKRVRLTCDKGEVEKIEISLWNGENIVVE
jgi:beta-mannosidase